MVDLDCTCLYRRMSFVVLRLSFGFSLLRTRIRSRSSYSSHLLNGVGVETPRSIMPAIRVYAIEYE